MLTHITNILVVSGLLLTAALASHAGGADATATGTASATILAPLQIINLNAAGLKFGQVIPSMSNPGTVTIAPNSTRSYTGVNVVDSKPYSAAHFQVSGAADNAFSITLPSSIEIVLSEDSSVTMTVDNFTSNPSGIGMLDSNGEAAVDVGATLHVNANQHHGRYDASFTVTVAYN